MFVGGGGDNIIRHFVVAYCIGVGGIISLDILLYMFCTSCVHSKKNYVLVFLYSIPGVFCLSGGGGIISLDILLLHIVYKL